MAAATANNNRSLGARLDLGTLGGLLLALGGILGGYYLEHGKVGDLLGESAALIVLGGSLGATLFANPLHAIKRAFRRAGDLLIEPRSHSEHLIDTIVNFATRARKNGIVSLEADTDQIADPFLRKSMTMAVDGLDLTDIRSAMELEMDIAERRMEEEARVFESAGGYAPTIGIIGAVLGLIIVMGDLQDMSKVGKGIAAAFVATIYGVGAANILFLPAAHKIKQRARSERERREMLLEGVCAIAEGMNPKMIRSRLEAYVRSSSEPPGGKESAAARRPAA